MPGWRRKQQKYKRRVDCSTAESDSGDVAMVDRHIFGLHDL